MTTTENVYVAEYVYRPYNQVCELLEAWNGHPLSSHVSMRPQYRLGDLQRVSRSVARLPVSRLGTVSSEQIAELRILPVNTGRNAVTELLLVAPGSSSMPREVRVRAAQWLLDTILWHLDAAPTLTAAGPRLAS